MNGALVNFLLSLVLMSLPYIATIPQCLPTKLPPTQYFYHNGHRRNVTLLTSNTIESRSCQFSNLVVYIIYYFRLISAVFSILVRTILGYDIQQVTLPTIPDMMSRENMFQYLSSCQNKL